MAGWTTTDLNAMLDSRVIDTVKLHSGDPGAAGTSNQIASATGSVAFGAASNGVRTQSADVDIPVGAGGSVQYASFWNGATFRCSDQVTTEVFASAGTYRLSGSTLTLANV